MSKRKWLKRSRGDVRSTYCSIVKPKVQYTAMLCKDTQKNVYWYVPDKIARRHIQYVQLIVKILFPAGILRSIN